MKEITYRKEGDYLIPNLALKNQENVVLGKYGKARLKYILKKINVAYILS
jgi:hypothetical protein